MSLSIVVAISVLGLVVTKFGGVSAYTCRAYLYTDSNYGGTSYGPFDIGDYEASGDFPNDKISSWKLTGTTNYDCFGYAFVDVDFAGDAQYMEADGATTSTMSYVGSSFNDAFSSLKIRYENEYCAVTLYQNNNYGGTSYGPFAIGEFNYNQLVARGFANDAVSSVKMSGSGAEYCTATFYQHSNFGGWSATITGTGSYTLAALQEEGFVNDEMSSMIVSVNDRLISVDWDIDAFEVLSQTPSAISATTLSNNSPADITKTTTFSKTLESSWEVSYGVEVSSTVAWETEFGVPALGVGGTLSVELSYSFSMDTSTSGSESTTYEEQLQITLEPYESVYCEWVMTQTTMDVPYTATIVTVDDYGQYTTEEVDGTWEGVSFYNSEIECTSLESDSLTAKQKALLQSSEVHHEQVHSKSSSNKPINRVVQGKHTIHSGDLKYQSKVRKVSHSSSDQEGDQKMNDSITLSTGSILLFGVAGVLCLVLLYVIWSYSCGCRGKKDGYQLLADGTKYGSTV